MAIGYLALLVLGLGLAGFFLGRYKALRSAKGNPRDLHSLPGYYGQVVVLFTTVPAFLLMAVWLVLQGPLIEVRVLGGLGPAVAPDATTARLVMADVRRIADGLDSLQSDNALSDSDLATLRADPADLRARLADAGVALGDDVRPEVFEAAKALRLQEKSGARAMATVVLLAALAGLAIALQRTNRDFRARNVTETFVLWLFIAAATIAILTTLGIVMSMLSESIRFFGMYPISDFYFGTVWNPQFRGGSELGLAPLLWGTMYISLVSMIVAVPIGLFAAIYTAEYASKRVRNVIKPLIEVIAGIPTVVFGLFALITVGPFLRDYFAEPTGLGSSGSSVMTAGIVIGILNIPFISSLADDIINAVPQAMRDGSLGLGATRSETVRNVVLPAALPGIMGAVLMAASRAIGETMIVTMGAGAAAKLSMNPFEAMTTMTVKIVSQLTGDTEFNSPETLVAFALGITLFVITLGLNVLALYIVRKYREQYE